MALPPNMVHQPSVKPQTIPTVTGEQVVAAARKYLNVPFKLHGRSIEGIDCLGLCVCVAREFGLDLDSTNYDMATGLRLEKGLLERHGFAQVSAGNVLPGDIWTFKNLTTGTATGVSIISGIGGSSLRISSVIHVETTWGFSAKPRWRCVEDRMGFNDVMQLFIRNISPEVILRASLFFRFPFVGT